jgi:hypothetical protein
VAEKQAEKQGLVYQDSRLIAQGSVVVDLYVYSSTISASKESGYLPYWLIVPEISKHERSVIYDME